MTFEKLNLPEPVLRGVVEAGFTSCTPIQAKSLPIALSGVDVAGLAQTATCETAAFLFSLLSRPLSHER